MLGFWMAVAIGVLGLAVWGAEKLEEALGHE